MKDELEKLYARITVWLTKKPQTKATWIMVFISCVMMWTLHQNQIVIKDNAKALEATLASLQLQKVTTSNAIHQIEIEEETRLNPNLECAYNWADDSFLFRNVGTTAAKDIFLNTSVYSIRSNEVMQLDSFRLGSGSILPPLEKEVLLPGETAKALQIYSPDKHWVAEFWKKYGGEILIRIFVEYNGVKPGYNRYSGYFNFTMSSNAKHEMASPFQRFLTEEEKPSLQKTIEQYNATPREHFKVVEWSGGTNDMEVLPFYLNDIGVHSIVSARSNGVFVLGSWAKHH